MAQASAFYTFADVGTLRADDEFNSVFACGLQVIQRGDALGQQPALGNEHIGEACQRHRHSHSRDVEKAHGAEVCPLEHQAVNNEVGAGTYQGATAAEDRRIAQWQHELGHRQTVAPAPLAHHRHKHGHHGRIVEKRAHPHYRQHQSRLGADHAAGFTQQPGPEGLNRAGVDQASHDHIQHRDRHQAGIGKPGERLRGVEHTEQQQGTQGSDQGDVRRETVADQQREASRHHQQRQPCIH